jgi:pimeloyl-ACP methyl ester carboxylesterase
MNDHTHDTAPTQFAEAGGIRFAYRRFGNPDTSRSPVAFFQHFIGNLDDHDPAISALGLKTADLLGHSMGGLVAQQVAIQRPDPARKLVLVGRHARAPIAV